MKRITALILCGLLCLGLAGCDGTLMNGDQEPEGYYETFGTLPPAVADAELLQTYKEAMYALAERRYAEARSLFTQLGDFRDAAVYASKFITIPDKLLEVQHYVDGVYILADTESFTYDFDGTLLKKERGEKVWKYSSVELEDGYRQDSVRCVQNGLTLESQMTLYQADGTVSQYVERMGDITTLTVKYNYDPDGVLYGDSGTQTRAFGLYGNDIRFSGDYVYDDDGRLMAYWRDYTWGILGDYRENYTYDEAGRMIRCEKTVDVHYNDAYSAQIVTEYEYDETGNLIRATETSHSIQLKHLGAQTVTDTNILTEYTYEDGHLVGIRETNETNGETTVIEEAYIYGDYLGYTG